ncbi:hypothetical protein B0H19DRAFT_1240577 [Mycena capillaripes]|nr:hypothetical protein B0H19DRAFT_1240577 [Mycena capillaripes]
MRAHFLSLLLVLCTLLASQAAPIGSRELSISSRKVKTAPKPVKAPKTVPKPVKAAPKPVKAAPKPVPKPVKAKPAAAPKDSKVATTSKGTACPIRKKGSKAGVKARDGSDTEDCEGASPEELCASFDDCVTCVESGKGLGCAFDVEGGKCIPDKTDLKLARDSNSCVTPPAPEKDPASEAVDKAVKDAATAAFSIKIQDHMFKGTDAKPRSGRHLLSIWTQKHPTSQENKRDRTTGIVEFPNGGPRDFKTVWNDEPDTEGTFVYKIEDIKALCLRGYDQSIRVNPSNRGTLLALKNPAPPTSGKGKGKGKSNPPPPPPR